MHIKQITVASCGHLVNEALTEVDVLNKSGAARTYTDPTGRFGTFATYGDLVDWFAHEHLRDPAAAPHVLVLNRNKSERFKETEHVFLTYANTNYTLTMEYE
jgi:hypothetical protein